MKQVEIFNVRIVKPGESYGLNFCLTNEGPKTLVEFYDSRYTHTKYGQFVSRYYLETLLDGDTYPNGLCLHGGVPSWSVSAQGMQEVLEFIKA
jgi:hypothetical protein